MGRAVHETRAPGPGKTCSRRARMTSTFPCAAPRSPFWTEDACRTATRSTVSPFWERLLSCDREPLKSDTSPAGTGKNEESLVPDIRLRETAPIRRPAAMKSAKSPAPESGGFGPHEHASRGRRHCARGKQRPPPRRQYGARETAGQENREQDERRGEVPANHAPEGRRCSARLYHFSLSRAARAAFFTAPV